RVGIAQTAPAFFVALNSGEFDVSVAFESRLLRRGSRVIDVSVAAGLLHGIDIRGAIHEVCPVDARGRLGCAYCRDVNVSSSGSVCRTKYREPSVARDVSVGQILFAIDGSQIKRAVFCRPCFNLSIERDSLKLHLSPVTPHRGYVTVD